MRKPTIQRESTFSYNIERYSLLALHLKAREAIMIAEDRRVLEIIMKQEDDKSGKEKGL